jgi:wyosine [tRNA(Phe)-imidazoG37] synthetase (radical SAM superfamily)
VLTNSALISREDVRADLAKADIVVAKLDAPDESLFRLISRPLVDVSLKDMVDGIRRFRSQWSGRLVLQMMFLAPNKRAADEMAALAAGLSPDEVQVNTPLRPSAAAPLSRQEIAAICESFKGLPVRSVYEAVPPAVTPVDVEATLRRRPGSLGGGSFP